MSLRTQASGFTLLEVMVAMLLMALFATAGYRALEAVLGAERHAGAELQRWRALATAFARIETDLGNLVPGVTSVASETRGLRLGLDGAQHPQVDWDRLLPSDEPGGLRRVGYVFHDGRLERLSWREQAPVTEAPVALPVLADLRRVEVRALDEQGVWQLRWPVPALAAGPVPTTLGDAPPRALEWRFELADGTAVRRVWLIR